MPKTNVFGGKKKKKGKNGILENKINKKLVLAEDEQYYASIEKVLGNGRFKVICYLNQTDNTDNITFSKKEMIGNICGKMRRKVWVHAGDLVIVSFREFSKAENAKCDIIHKYTNDEAKKIIKKGLIPTNEMNDTGNITFNFSDSEEDDGEKNEVAEKNTFKKKNKTEPYLVLDMPTFSSEEELEED